MNDEKIVCLVAAAGKGKEKVAAHVSQLVLQDVHQRAQAQHQAVQWTEQRAQQTKNESQSQGMAPTAVPGQEDDVYRVALALESQRGATEDVHHGLGVVSGAHGRAHGRAALG